VGGNDREAKDEEGKACTISPLYTNKFCVSRCFFIYFQRTGLTEYLHNNLHKSLKIEGECAKFRFEFGSIKKEVSGKE